MGLGYVVPSLIVTDFNLNATDYKNNNNDVSNLFSVDTGMLKDQLLILVSISTGVSILNLVGMILIYDRDPVQAPNNAERRRSTIMTESLKASILTQLSISQQDLSVEPILLPIRKITSHQKIKNYLKSVKNIISNKNCRYMMISQRKNFITGFVI